MAARIDLERLPLATELADYPVAEQERHVLHGGDDYELAFTPPVAQRAAVAAAAQASATPVTRIGCIEAAPGLRLIDAHGQPMPQRYASFDHFA